jgi:hypothetical protein
MNIAEINKLLSSDYSSIESFEKNSTWEDHIKGHSINKTFAKEFAHKLDWNYISQSYKLSEDFIRLNCDNLNWHYISIYQKLSENLIRDFHNRIHWYWIVQRQSLPEQFIEEFIIDLTLESVLLYQDVSISFLERNNNEINWGSLWYQMNKMKLFKNIEKYGDFIGWDSISDLTNLPEELIKKHQNKVDWNIVSKRRTLSEDFINEFQGKLDWNYIGQRDEYSVSFIKAHQDKLKNVLLKTDDIAVIRELKDCISFKEINYQDFSEEQIFEFRDKIDLESLIKGRRLSEDLMESCSEYFTDWSWRWLSDLQPLSEDFIKKFYNKVHWGGISCHQILSEDFIKEVYYEFHHGFISRKYAIDNYKYQIWWEYIVKYQKLSSDFCKTISNKFWSNRKYIMLPYQKNEFTIQLLSSLNEDERSKYLADSWLFKSTDFRKEQIVNLGLFDCFDYYFIASIIVDKNRYSPFYFHHQFNKDESLEIFATQTNEERTKGFVVGKYEVLCDYYHLNEISVPDWKSKYFSLNVKVMYNDVAHVIEIAREGYMSRSKSIVKCGKLVVLE